MPGFIMAPLLAVGTPRGPAYSADSQKVKILYVKILKLPIDDIHEPLFEVYSSNRVFANTHENSLLTHR